MHLVDTVEVEPEHVEGYLELIGTLGMAVMTDAGRPSCRVRPRRARSASGCTSRWSGPFDDLGHWNEIRKNLVLDPRYHEYGSTAASLRVGGTRRFFTAGGPPRATP